MKFTKIVATIGPATETKEMLQKLVDAGMDVARLNFSHGDHKYFKTVINNIRSIGDDIAIMLDTKGPEIRTSKTTSPCMFLEGDLVEVTNKKSVCTKEKISINYKALSKLKVGDMVLLDDGLLELKIVQTRKKVVAQFLNGGILGSNKSVTIKGHSIEVPFLSEKDKEDILFGINENLSFVAASFVRRADDVLQLRAFLNKYNSKVKIISKIEHIEAVKNLEEIIRVSDGVMVARGDLGVEISLEKVPEIQERVIKRCNQLGKPVIVATQMLESMKENPRPTRAEVSDVAHAIHDGADAIMLSGETTVGKYPVKAVKTFTKIAKEMDMRVPETLEEESGRTEKDRIALFITKVAYLASKKLKTAAILAPTETGFTARMVSRFKPKCPILAITPDLTVMRQLRLSWGVIPMLETKMHKKLDNMVDHLVRKSYKRKFISKDDLIVVTAGYKVAEMGHTNLIEVYYVREVLSRISGRR